MIDITKYSDGELAAVTMNDEYMWKLSEENKEQFLELVRTTYVYTDSQWDDLLERLG